MLRFEFTGPLVGVIHGDSARGGRATVSIDDEQKRNLTFTGDRRRIRFGQKLIYRRLGPGSHTIRIVMLDDSQGFVEGFTMRR